MSHCEWVVQTIECHLTKMVPKRVLTGEERVETKSQKSEYDRNHRQNITEYQTTISRKRNTQNARNNIEEEIVLLVRWKVEHDQNQHQNKTEDQRTMSGKGKENSKC